MHFAVQVTKPKAAPKAKKPVAKKAKVAKPTSAKKVGIDDVVHTIHALN